MKYQKSNLKYQNVGNLRIFVTALSFMFCLVGCTTKVVVSQGPATSPMAPEFYLKPVAPITGADYAVDTIGAVGKVDWGTGSIKAKGTGVLDPANPNKGQARVMAERAAVVDAQRNLLETAKGVRVNGETQVKDFMTQSDIIYTRVDGLVKGARLASEPKYDSALGTVQIELEISLYDKKGLGDAVAQPGVTKTLQDLTPQEKELLQKYSSVVFDASGTGLKPALFPKIYDENGNLLFDTGTYVDTASAYGKRVIQYVKSLDRILENPDLKNNPVIIKIKEIRGKLDGDIVISKENADKYKWLKDTFKFLLNAGRTFIKLL